MIVIIVEIYVAENCLNCVPKYEGGYCQIDSLTKKLYK